MAYREFSQPTPMKAAKFEGMPNLINSIQQNSVLKAKEREDAAKAQREVDKRINDLDRSVAQGAYVQDQELINKIAKESVNAHIADLNETGRVSPKTAEMEQGALNMATKSKQQFKEFQTMKTDAFNISKNDPYFNYTLADAKIRNEEIKSLDQRDVKNVSLEGDEYFMFDKYRADYISEQNKTVKNPMLKNGKTVGHTEVSGNFLDAKGNINVTDQDAKSFLNSEYKEKLHNHYNSELDAQYDAEIISMRAVGAPWMEGLTHDQIKTAIISNPELNKMDGRTFAERKLQMAKDDLREGARIDKLTNTNFVERKDSEPKTYGGVGQERNKIRANAFGETLDKIVFTNEEDALSTVYGALEGVKNYQFNYGPITSPLGVSEEIEGITLVFRDPKHPDETLPPKNIPLKTFEDKLNARVELAKYKNQQADFVEEKVSLDVIREQNDRLREEKSAKDKEAKSNTKYSFNGKSLTHKGLIELEYTEEQIQQAIKMGNITVSK